MSILLGLVAFVIIVGVFLVVFRRVPGLWEWVGLLLAGLGAVFAVPSGLQRLFGRAKLLRKYDRYVQGEERALIVFLKNPPLDKRSFLRVLDVRREAISSLSASFRISEAGKVIVPIMHCRVYADDDPTDAGSWRIALPPTLSWSTSIMVATWDDNKKRLFCLVI